MAASPHYHADVGDEGDDYVDTLPAAISKQRNMTSISSQLMRPGPLARRARLECRRAGTRAIIIAAHAATPSLSACRDAECYIAPHIVRRWLYASVSLMPAREADAASGAGK